MTVEEVVGKVLMQTEEMTEDELKKHARIALGSVSPNTTVNCLYVVSHNLSKLGEYMEWMLAHNQLDQTKSELFVPGYDVKKAMV